MKEINVLVTMDCEPTTQTTHAKATGPRDWDHGERAVTGYFDVGMSYGFPATFFIHPETIQAQTKMFKSLESKGACLGLHMHPWKYSMWRYQGKKFMENYGGMPEETQVELLNECREIWREATGGGEPRYFRAGSFSGNDAIFRALVKCGFRGGSCSVPGRIWPDVRTVWAGAEPDPHRANDQFRQAKGRLEFVNVPVSVDYSTVLTQGTKGRRLHPDPRPDTDWVKEYGIDYDTIATNIVTQTVARNPEVAVIVVVTHNHYEYRNAADPTTIRLKQSLDAICKACDKAGIKAVGNTVGGIADIILSKPLPPEEFVPPESAWAVGG